MALAENFQDDGIPQFLLRERVPYAQEMKPRNGSVATSLLALWDRTRRVASLLFSGDSDFGNEGIDQMVRNGTDAREDLASEIAHQRQGQRVSQPVGNGGAGVDLGKPLHAAIMAFKDVHGDLALHAMLTSLAEQSADRLRSHGVHVNASGDTETVRANLNEASKAAHYWKRKHDELASQEKQQGEPGMGQVN